MLEVDAVRFRYGPRLPWVVDGAHLRIPPGAILGLHGPSGTGKSTLARLVAGFLRPASGRILADGEPPAPGRGRPNPVQLVLQHAERAFDPRVRIRASLAETGADPAALASVDPQLVSPRWLDRYPHEMSGGELQRVNLARALLTAPRYLVADEISASLDALTQARLWHLLIDRVRRDSIGVLAISHDLALLDAVADRVLEWDDLADRGWASVATV
ncbi:ABC transporter ATP-binding protein [Pseudonocardia hispaniensis]|uniref:ABC transporter ATP-binding protein n=1 Tax=Pseudonocardia hispaniensis TaxID=904933 RepID=A0ABW1J779_9PSEU